MRVVITHSLEEFFVNIYESFIDWLDSGGFVQKFDAYVGRQPKTNSDCFILNQLHLFEYKLWGRQKTYATILK